MHEFSRITEYFSKGNSFQMTIGTMFRGITFVCETPNVSDGLWMYFDAWQNTEFPLEWMPINVKENKIWRERFAQKESFFSFSGPHDRRPPQILRQHVWKGKAGPP